VVVVVRGNVARMAAGAVIAATASLRVVDRYSSVRRENRLLTAEVADAGAVAEKIVFVIAVITVVARRPSVAGTLGVGPQFVDDLEWGQSRKRMKGPGIWGHRCRQWTWLQQVTTE